MIANRDRFDTSKSNDIAEQIKQQMTFEANRYFTTNVITDQASRQEYDKFKQNVEKNGSDIQICQHVPLRRSPRLNGCGGIRRFL